MSAAARFDEPLTRLKYCQTFRQQPVRFIYNVVPVREVTRTTGVDSSGLPAGNRLSIPRIVWQTRLGQSGQTLVSRSDAAFGNWAKIQTASRMRTTSLRRRAIEKGQYLALTMSFLSAVIFAAAAPLMAEESYFRTGLIVPVKKVIPIKTSLCRISCNPGTLVFFIDTGSSVAVYDCHSTRSGDVTVTTRDHEMRTLPGEEILVTSQEKLSFEKVNPGKGISIRDPKLAMDKNGLRIFTADFSIPSAMIAIKPLKAMLHSKDDYQRQLAEKVLKDAVIRSQVSAAKGPFVPAN